ncbi:MAG: DUF6252 family protein [Myxococcaceae bacterium]
MGTVVATWTAKEVDESAGSAVYVSDGGSFLVSVKDCNDNSLVTLSEIPAPVAVGSYALKYKPNHNLPLDGNAGGQYDIIGDTSYFTDGNGTGSVVITEVDAAKKQFSGTFSFSGTDDTGGKTVEVSNGVLTKIDFQ